MASKESSRYKSLAESLKALRAKPPSVLGTPVIFSIYSQQLEKDESAKALLDQVVAIDSSKHQVVALLEQVIHLKKICIRVGAVRVNKWGKFEVLLPELVGALKALKATPLEIDELSWVSFNTSDEVQKKFIEEKIASVEPCNFGLRLLEVKFGKNNGMFPGGKDPVFGQWQIVKFTAPVDASPPSTPESSEPPAKKRKTSGGSKKEKAVEKEKTIHEAAREIAREIIESAEPLDVVS